MFFLVHAANLNSNGNMAMYYHTLLIPIIANYICSVWGFPFIKIH